MYCRGVSAFDRGQWIPAIEALDAALHGLNSFDHRVEFLAAHYCLGCCYESIGDMDAAEKHLFEVLVLDYDYKDALQRMERIRPEKN